MSGTDAAWTVVTDTTPSANPVQTQSITASYPAVSDHGIWELFDSADKVIFQVPLHRLLYAQKQPATASAAPESAG